MSAGFQVTGSASAILFGLVLVSITFGYNAALSRFESLADYKHFVNWFWSAGLATCIYFSFCFIISVHVTRSQYAYHNLVAILLITWFVLAMLHILETFRLYQVSMTDWPWFKKIFINETLVIVVLFGIFTVLTFWALFFTKTLAGRYTMLFSAVRYTLIFAAIRAIFLVRYTFAVLMELTLLEERRKTDGE